MGGWVSKEFDANDHISMVNRRHDWDEDDKTQLPRDGRG